MKVEFINPFVSAGIDVLAQLIGGRIEREQLAVRSIIYTTHQLSIHIGVSGAVNGQVIYGMSQSTAVKITAAMTSSPQVAFDDMTIKAIGELGNIIANNSVRLLSEAGFHCDLAPPTVIRGRQIEVAVSTPALIVPLSTACGKIEINVALTAERGGAAETTT
ncbi:MAG: chemotaxis protein CheX [Armatimonadota bacterium]